MPDTAVEQVRSFTRTVTQRSGALNDRFLARGRPLGQARMLWEIGTEGCEVRSLRSRLGLDSGHASRLMRALEADGLVCVEPSPNDRRIRIARLTAEGLAERAVLDRRSDDLAASILEPLDQPERDQMIDAMRTIRRLMARSLVEIVVADPAGRDAKRCIRAYFAELDRRSESRFDPTAGISAEPHELVAPAGVFLIAYMYGEPVGCGAAKHHPGAPSHIKRMWVAESARGLGIGRRLLTELEGHVARSGATVAQLETQRTLVEAFAMYRSAGYREVPAFNAEPFAHHWFEKRVG
jgi:DNA-binding MarR family transcriptional regulator/GNAT superfamily N-acetyltransferase